MYTIILHTYFTYPSQTKKNPFYYNATDHLLFSCFLRLMRKWEISKFPMKQFKKKISCDSSLNSVIIGDSTELHCSLMGRDNAGQPRPNNYLVLHTYLLTIHNTWKRNGILHSPHLMQRVLQLDMTIDETCFFEAIQTFVLGQLCMHGGS